MTKIISELVSIALSLKNLLLHLLMKDLPQETSVFFINQKKLDQENFQQNQTQMEVWGKLLRVTLNLILKTKPLKENGVVGNQIKFL